MFKMISELSLMDRVKYGNKASNLGELNTRGFEVPDGFAISNEVFIEYMSYNNITFTIEECLARNERISKQIINGEFPIKLKNELENLFNNISQNGLNQKIVVRSSASYEDNKEHSMAGMFESFINLSSFDEVLKSIKQCYASAFDDKIIDYIVSNNLEIESLKMGIVVQKFIIGEYSGVIFSVDTIDMREENMHINIVSGVCDNFVSGKNASSFFSVNKKDGKIVEQKIQQEHESFPIKYIDDLFEITLKIEKCMNEKVDIEWTILENKVYILQVRPITTFKIKDFPVIWSKTGDENYTWYCESNEPWMPLIHDISKKEGDALNKDAYDVGDEYGYMDFIEQNGYSYYRMVDMPNKEEQKKVFKDEVNRLFHDGINIFQHIIYPKLSEYTNELDSYVMADKNAKMVWEFLEKSLKYMEYTAQNHLKAVHSCDYVNDFENYCKDIIAELSQEDFYDLISNDSFLSKEREYYVTMAEIINSNDKIKELFGKGNYYESIYEHLKVMPEAKKFLSIMDDYIRDYGISQLDCDTLSSKIEPTLLENPARALKYIKGFMDVDAKDYFNSIDKCKKNKERVKALFLERLDESQSEEFLCKLNVAEDSFLSRDNHHYYFERKSNAYLSLAITAAANMLKNNEIINKKDDINYLKIDEIKIGLIHETKQTSLIKERKMEYEKQKVLLAPEFIGKEPDKGSDAWDESNSEIKKCSLTTLNGLSGLRKKVKGKVCRGIPISIEKESILVVPFTRCGDIFPVIDKVIGVIVENGSPFEHLGIILRELNIPSIYNVKDACALLEDGDEIELDGIKGEVIILNKNN